jgi:hypothetical protein
MIGELERQPREEVETESRKLLADGGVKQDVWRSRVEVGRQPRGSVGRIESCIFEQPASGRRFQEVRAGNAGHRAVSRGRLRKAMDALQRARRDPVVVRHEVHPVACRELERFDRVFECALIVHC